MSIKTKVAFGVLFLFLLILMVGALGIHYLNSLSRDSQNILTDNYESLEFSKHIIEGTNTYRQDPVASQDKIEKNLQLQESNITEPGEKEVTHELRVTFEKLQNGAFDDSLLVVMRAQCFALQDLNMKAIIRKSETSQRTAERAKTYLIIIVTVCGIAGFIFIMNFPGYIANPIVQLTNSIRSIAEKNYEERLHFQRRDEFEELAEAFNLMAEKLDEYEHSNLSKLLSEKKRIETIINRINDPLIGLDENNYVVFANDQALNLLHLNGNEIIGKYAPDVAVNNDLFRNLIKNGKSGDDSSALIKVALEGRENYFSREAIQVQHKATGEKESVKIGEVIMLKNITPYKELDLAKTNFIATISHELKTPIAALQMCSKLLQDQRVGNLNEEQRNVVATLSDEIQRLSKITNELLDLSQVETGNIKLNIKRALANDIVDLALESVKFQAERKHVKIDVQRPEESPAILADVDKSTWVLINFLTNAIRHSPENDHLILRCSSSNGHVIFSVRDHGPGIDAKYLDRIFEKFYQVPGTPGGTGLGLAISKEFIEAQHGKINVESRIGEGSEFSFELPRG